MKTIKKIFVLLVALVMLLNIPMPATAANPEDGDTLYVDTRTTANNSDTGNPYIMSDGLPYCFFRVREFENNPCYCIEHNAVFTNTYYKAVELDESKYWESLSKTKREGIALVAAFGYPAQSAKNLGVEKAADAYVATQALIWEIQTGARKKPTSELEDNTYRNTLKGTPALEAYKTILSKIEAYVSDARYEGDTDSLVGFVNLTSASGYAEQEMICFYGDTPEFIAKGNIEINKKDPDGKKLDGAKFKVYKEDGTYVTSIGPTKDGYAKSKKINFGTYTVKETTFPENYEANGKSSWEVTIDDENLTVTINAVNKLKKGSIKIVKTSEDGVVAGIKFTIKGNDVNKTVTTEDDGEIKVPNLVPGNYEITEQSINKYEPQETRTVTVVSDKTTTVTFNNVLKRGSLKVTKTSEDGLVKGVQFKLSGTSLSGHKVEQYATTNANGIATFSDVLISGSTDYVLSEVNTAARYVVPSNQSAVIEWNKVTQKSVYNQLKRGSLKVTKTSEDGLVEGVRFKLSGTSLSDENVQLYATTNKSGIAEFNDVLISDSEGYTIEEVNTHERYEAPTSQTAVIEWNKITNKTFNNKLKRGDLKVTKTSEDGLTEGLKFHLSGTSFSGITVDEYATTNKNGIATFENILIGENYILKEVDTPKKYVVPSSKNAIVEWNKETGYTFKNILKKWRAEVSKIDSDFTEKSKTQGNATLEGATYGVYKSGELMDTYTTDKKGKFVTKYYVCDDDWTIQEITPSEGYLLDSTVYKIDSEPSKYSIELNTERVSVYEDVIKSKIAIIKHADDGSTQIENPEVDATFEVFLKSSGSYEQSKSTERDILVTNKYGFAETKLLPYGIYTVKQTRGNPGTQLMPAFDVNINADGEIYRYLINNSVFKADVEIIKKDAETGKTIPIAGVGFKVRDINSGEYIVQHIKYPTPMDIEVYYTDKAGKLMLPEALPFGNYEIIEQCTAYGYILDGTTVPFVVDGSKDVVTVEKYNMSQKGTITVFKNGEVFSSVVERDGMYQPIYEMRGLKGAVYKITAAEDVITLDGTLRYEKNEVVATITTNEDGIASTEPLYLGKFKVKEVTAPYGMVLSKSETLVELVYAGQEIELTSVSTSFVNDRQKAKINLLKTLEQDFKYDIGYKNEIGSVQFGLFAGKDIVAYDGSVIPKDSLIETAFCDNKGEIFFITDLPVGAGVYLKEIATDKHYIISDERYPVTFEYAGQEVSTLVITANNGISIDNKLIRGRIIGKKLDEDGTVIKGTIFGLFKATETSFSETSALQLCETDHNGIFLFNNVPYGKWLVKELKAAEGFVPNNNVYEVTVQENEQIIELEIENLFIVGSVITTKVDEDVPQNKLSGAIFEIYKDTDGNQKFCSDTDVFVGEMQEISQGNYRLDSLRYGGYFLYEKIAPENYIKDDNYYYFEIRNNREVVSVENEAGKGFVNQPFKGNIKILKKDADTRKALSKVEFALFDKQGNEVARGITDKKGTLIFKNIRFGEYEIREITPKVGYEKINKKFPIEITENDQVITVNIENKKIPESPKTGENLPIIPILIFTASFVLIGFGTILRKRNHN